MIQQLFRLCVVLWLSLLGTQRVFSDCFSCDGGAQQVVFKLYSTSGEQGPLKKVTLKTPGGECHLGQERLATLKPGKNYILTIEAEFKPHMAESCPSDNVVMEISCPLSSASRTFGFYLNRYPDHANHTGERFMISLPASSNPDRGSTDPELNFGNPGAGSSATNNPFQSIITPAPTGGGISIERLAPAATAEIPLGFLKSNGVYTEAGSLSFSHVLGTSPITASAFELTSLFLDDADAAPLVRWASTDENANPRFAIAPEAVAKITRVGTTATVEVYPRDSFDEASKTFNAPAIASYEYSLSGLDQLTMREWTGGDPVEGDPTKMRVYEKGDDPIEGEYFSVEENGRRELTTEILGHLDSLPVNASSNPRKLLRIVTKSVFDQGKCISVVEEEYRYIPVRQIEYPEFVPGGPQVPFLGGLAEIREVLISRCRDENRPVSGPNVIQGPTETWYYYGQDVELPAAEHHVTGRVKQSVASDGSWVMYGYDEAGNEQFRYEPWLSTPPEPSLTTAPENPVAVAVVDESLQFAGPVKFTETYLDVATDTSYSEATTYLVDYEGGTRGARIISKDVSNTIYGAGGDDNESITYNEAHTEKTRRLVGTWTPSSGNAWTEFSPDGTNPPHRMVITTKGPYWVTGHEHGQGFYVLPEHSTQEIAIYGNEGLLLRETRVLPASVGANVEEDAFEPASRETYSYDARGRKTGVIRDGRVVQQIRYDSRDTTTVIDQSGIETTTEVDAQGRTIRETTAAGGGVDAIERTTEYDGLEVRRKENGILVSRTLTDLVGRIIEEEDQTGAVNRAQYSADGRVVTRILPGHHETPGGEAKITTTTHRDGRPDFVIGTGTVAKYYVYGLEVDPVTYPFTSKVPGSPPITESRYHQTTTEFTGSNPSPRYQTTVYSWNGGKLLKTITPDAATGAAITTTTLGSPEEGEYTGTGTLGGGNASYRAETPAGYMGMESYYGTSEGWAAGVPTGKTRLIHSLQSYVKREDGHWWLRSREIQGEGVTYATRQNETLTRLWQEDGVRTITSTADGEFVDSFTTFDIATKTEETVATSNRSNVSMIAHVVNGYLQWSRERHLVQPEFRATYGYDPSSGRLVSTKDHHGVVTRRVYNGQGQLLKTIDTLGRATAYTYVPPGTHGTGRIAGMVKPDGTTTTYTYTARGETAGIGGTSEYPQSFGYNVYGDRETLTTTNAAGSSVTRWTYNAAGLVEAKYSDWQAGAPSDPAGTLRYTYDPNGRLLLQEVIGGKSTRYQYNALGELTAIDFGAANATLDPNVIITRDAVGLVTGVTENYEDADGNPLATGTTLYSYVGGRPDQVTYDANHPYLPGVVLDYKAAGTTGLPTGYDVLNQSVNQLNVAYGFAPNGLVASIGMTGLNYSYFYGSDNRVLGYQAGNSAVLHNRTFDNLGRIASMITYTGSNRSDVSYAYDRADRRTLARREDGSYWSYGYNLHGEVTSAKRHMAGGVVINGLERHYDYDDIGNRKSAKFGGGPGAALSQITYTVDGDNRYSKIGHPGKDWVVGIAPESSAVTVNGAAATRQGKWYSKELTATNDAGPVALPVEVATVTVNPATASGHLSIPAETAVRGHDAAGNLANDGKWAYEWDSANRLRKMHLEATSAGFPNRTIEFVYDWQGRRIAKKVTEGTVISHTRYLCEGWNVIAEWSFTGSSTAALGAPRTYLWGLDLGGQSTGNINDLQNAGGVGGLLGVKDPVHGFVHASYDGNGNIIAWSGASGQLLQTRDYDAFGNLVLRRQHATVPFEMTYGFSTKPEDPETGLLYYGYRYYDPVTGRWPSKDPIEEEGGVNLYGFLENNPLLAWDYLGNYPMIKNLIEPGKPIGESGEVALRYRTASELKKVPCGEGSAQVVWSSDSFGKLTGKWGVDIATWNHEAHHVDGYESAWRRYLKYAEDLYFNKCMCEKKAACYNNVTPLMGLVAYLEGQVVASELHLRGGVRNGQKISSYSASDIGIYNVSGKLASSKRALASTKKQIRETLEKCQNIK